MLGYYLDFQDPGLIRYIKKGKTRFKKRFMTIVKYLNAKGLKLTYPMLENETGYVGGGAVVYAMLVQAGKADFTDADWHEYDGYLREAERTLGPELDPPSTYEVLEMIKKFKGVPVLAHPYSSRPEKLLPVPLVADLIKRGVKGLEILGKRNPPEDPYICKLIKLAKEYGLVLTGGSDTHNKGKRCEMGRNAFDYNDGLLQFLNTL